MRKILLFLMLVCAVQVSSAQVYDIYIPDGVVLTNNQWHTKGYSVVEANNNMYLVIYPDRYEYYQLRQLDIYAFGRKEADVFFSYKPYIYNNMLGWLVEGEKACYFVYPSGGHVILNWRPIYYDYWYDFGFKRYLDLSSYYWYRPNYVPRPVLRGEPIYRLYLRPGYTPPPPVFGPLHRYNYYPPRPPHRGYQQGRPPHGRSRHSPPRR